MRKSKAAPFPWDAAMTFGFGVLKLSAAEFWALTPIELTAAMRAHGLQTSHPMDHPMLDALMAQFPDQKQHK
ncbi:MAG: rcc01693 family protein [Pseudomonadota bacterium]